MEGRLISQSEDDNHSEGQEETRGSKLCCIMWSMNVVMVITDHHHKQVSPSKNHCVLS